MITRKRSALSVVACLAVFCAAFAVGRLAAAQAQSSGNTTSVSALSIRAATAPPASFQFSATGKTTLVVYPRGGDGADSWFPAKVEIRPEMPADVLVCLDDLPCLTVETMRRHWPRAKGGPDGGQ